MNGSYKSVVFFENKALMHFINNFIKNICYTYALMQSNEKVYIILYFSGIY